MKQVFTLFIFTLILSFSTSAQTEIIEKPKVVKVKIFPNPATKVVNVLGLKNSQKAAITISDVYGNVVLEHWWEIRRQAVSIPIPNLEAGIYVIRISSVEQKVQAKFYKQ